jgi:hypothetical protein
LWKSCASRITRTSSLEKIWRLGNWAR